jgi:hypothetical protein
VQTLTTERGLVKPCPNPGQGVHHWLYGAVCTLLRHRTSPRAIEGILRPLMTRPEQPGEIANTIKTAMANLALGVHGADISLHSPPLLRSSKWPIASAPKMEAIFASFGDVTISSWEQISDPGKGQEEILRWAFLPGEFVCTGNKITKPDGAKYYELKTSSLEGAIRMAPSRQHIVPNPFHSRTGKTKTGKSTCKSDGQVKSRRFLVIEFDFRSFEWTCNFTREESLDHQGRLHWHLANEYPLCLLVYSGSESVHGWYATLRPRQLMRAAAELGCDNRLWSVSQFTRMPWGLHANGTRQRVIFFKPENAAPL